MQAKILNLTQERLREVLSYDPETGIFKNRISRGRSRVGAIIGCMYTCGYTMIVLCSERIYAHRLAWFYQHGRWPKNQLDHINGNRSDNRLVNLREATNQENQMNAKIPITNTSGFKGVSWYSKRQKWHAQIQFGVNMHIGFFDSKEGARDAYESAAHKLFGKFKKKL